MSFEIDVSVPNELTAIEARLAAVGIHMDGGNGYRSVEDPAGNTVVLSASEAPQDDKLPRETS